MTELETLGPEGKRTSFKCEGSVATKATLLQTGNPVIDAAFFEAALQQFAGREAKGVSKKTIRRTVGLVNGCGTSPAI